MIGLQSLKIVLLALALMASGCEAGSGDAAGQQASKSSPSPAAQQTPQPPAPVYTYEVVNTWPHDKTAFTQGLIYHDGAFIESTGQYGLSSLRRVEPKTGRVLQKVDVAPQYFAEGMTLFQGRIIQLTWRSRRGFIYDPVSFEQQGDFYFDGEGWGLTHDEQRLILSDGTSQIRFLHPASFSSTKTITVLDQGQPVRDINELEYVHGEIYANIWHTDRIARIDPNTGKVIGWIDLTGLLPAEERGNSEAVLNGIAYDEKGDRLFVTGKLWPKLFEIRLKSKQ